VGILSSQNNTPWDLALRDFYAVPRDIRQRVLFDPTAVFVGGLSGGGENSYMFSRFHAQHVAGVLSMGGWLARYPGSVSISPYCSIDRVQTNLLVARTTGTTDTATLYYNPYDSNYLAACGAVIKDWLFPGGHQTAPASVKTACLQWLLSSRIPAVASDRTNSLAQAVDWRSRIAARQSEAVLRECLATLMSRPRTWFALQAQLVVDDLMTNYTSFRSLEVSNLYSAGGTYVTNYFATTNDDNAFIWNNYPTTNYLWVNYWSQSDFASDLFYYFARGAAINHDWQRYDCALKALTGISGVNGDRAGNIYWLLATNGYVRPILTITNDPILGQATLRLQKDAPTLAYTLQARRDFANDTWQNVSPPAALESDTAWSSTQGLDPTAASVFYRLSANTNLIIASPPWPQN
jgi:hypothetical protein